MVKIPDICGYSFWYCQLLRIDYVHIADSVRISFHWETNADKTMYIFIYINIMVDVAQCFGYSWHPRFFRSLRFYRLQVFVFILTDLLSLLFSYSTVTVCGDGLDSNLRYYEHYIDSLLRSALSLNLTTNLQAVPWSRQTKQYLHFPKALHAMELD
jgi:hypothetical protein